MRYRKLTGVVLKKQNYKEADQIVTVYTEEVGKIRVLAKALRSSKSKLSGSFQDLSLVAFEVTGSKSLPTLISSKSAENFTRLKTDLPKTAIGFYGVELLIRLTADEEKNVPIFELLVAFLQHLNQIEPDEARLYATLDNFCLRLLSAAGFSIEFAQDGLKLPASLKPAVDRLRTAEFASIESLQIDLAAARQIHKSVTEFIEYILERDIKSDTFLTTTV